MLNAEAQEIQVIGNELVIKLRRDTRPLSDIQTLNAVIAYTNAEGAQKSVSVSVPVMAQAILSPTSAPTTPTETISPSPDQTSFAQAIILAILGGLILNLMPCVFPVLSMKALSL